MNVLNVLDSLGSCVLAGSEMAVDKGEERGIDLHEEKDGTFVAQTIFEASFDLAPLVFVYSVVDVAADKDKGGNSYEIMIGKMNKRFSNILANIIEMFLYNFLPLGNNILIVTHQDIKRAELYHFLKADNNNISFIY